MKKTILLILSIVCNIPAQTQELSVTIKGSYTTNTRFMYNIERVQFFDEGRILGSNFGYGADVRMKILWERFFIGVSYEKIEASEEFQMFIPQLDYLGVPVNEGFQLRGLEISGYYVVPISSENIQFYLGGGFGLYDGDRIYSIASATAAMTESQSNVGIHVFTGIDYKVASHFALRGELKFRDPHFDVKTKFDQLTVEYAGKNIRLDQNETTTRINLYGVNYMVGLVFLL
jgi:hypothetical protein